jgi:hypothetical protein
MQFTLMKSFQMANFPVLLGEQWRLVKQRDLGVTLSFRVFHHRAIVART